jgi:ABC-2 type transport system permease protein
MIAPQVVAGLLQKVAMTSMPDLMAEKGMKYLDQFAGGLTPEQRERMNEGLRENASGKRAARCTQTPAGRAAESSPSHPARSSAKTSDNPMVSFYAAAIGVMFLLFTASGAAGALLDEAESGTLDRVLSSRVTMTTLWLGKLTYNTLLAFTQLV